jgi:uncharacterized protein (TIGR04168 family)
VTPPLLFLDSGSIVPVGSPAAARPVRIAVIGDVHLFWDDGDVTYFDRAGYDLMLFVGDVVAYSHRRALPVLRSMGRLHVPALLIAGNHDGVRLPQLVAELFGWGALADLLGRGQARRCEQIRAALGPVLLCGYSLHPFSTRGVEFAVLAARPHSMGGARLAYRHHVSRAFGVGGMEESSARLKALVDACAVDRLVVLAHNGPSGLGERRDDIWGCDFRRDEGDFGDADLRAAIEHAKRSGKRVPAVVAGHMHQAVKGGGERAWSVERDGTLYVNAARVPRVFERDGCRVRHHVLLEIGRNGAEAKEILVPEPRSASRSLGNRSA